MMSTNKQRIQAVDVLRGITVAGMVLVNNGWGDTYAPLCHAEWNGLTPTDLVFPFFLFVMGISTYLSLQKFQFRLSAPVARKIVRRTVLIFFIGLCIPWTVKALNGNFFPYESIRVMGVLQRIALCYCAAAFLLTLVSHRYLPHVVFLLLAAYALILLWGNGYAQDPTNIAWRIDDAILGPNHIYRRAPIDPEGLLGTVPAIAHTLLGSLVGSVVASRNLTMERKIMHVMLAGGSLLIGGWLLSYGLPINKTVWSPSYVLVTCGLASLLLGILMNAIDIRGHRWWIMPFLVFGVNPLFLFVLHDAFAIFGGHFGLNAQLYHGILSAVGDTYLASLLYALTFVVLCFLVGWPLWKKHIYIKI